MKYWVNEDKPTNRVRVHKETCPHGVDQEKNPKHGGWSSFATREQADAHAASTDRRDAADCATCFPETPVSVMKPAPRRGK